MLSLFIFRSRRSFRSVFLYFVHHLPVLVNQTENEVLFIVTSPLVFLSLATTAFQQLEAGYISCWKVLRRSTYASEIR